MKVKNKTTLQEEKNKRLEGEELEKTVEEISKVEQMSPTKLVLRRFFRSKLSVVGLIIVVGLFVFSFLGPYILTLLDKIDFLNIITVWGETQADETTGSTVLVEIPFSYTRITCSKTKG